jgi:hypothetical protein
LISANFSVNILIGEEKGKGGISLVGFLADKPKSG